MAWLKNERASAKYRTPEHRAMRKALAYQMRRDGTLVCAQPICVKPTRVIQSGEAWHVGHNDDGTAYIGAVHAACNVKDAARRANARQRSSPLKW